MIFLPKFASRSLYSPFREIMNNLWEIDKNEEKNFQCSVDNLTIVFLAYTYSLQYTISLYYYFIHLLQRNERDFCLENYYQCVII